MSDRGRLLAVIDRQKQIIDAKDKEIQYYLAKIKALHEAIAQGIHNQPMVWYVEHNVNTQLDELIGRITNE